MPRAGAFVHDGALASEALLAIGFATMGRSIESNAELGSRCAIAVMAKAPQAGRSKTRLAPPLSPEQAAMLSGAFLRDTTESIAIAARDAPISGHVAYAPAGGESLFLEHVAAITRFVLADGSGGKAPHVEGFGRCLLHAMRSLLAEGFAAACVLNSDGPTLPTERLRRAARLLLAPGDRAVLGPSEDGGYYLLGLKTPEAAMFADIAWSTGDVAEQTRARARGIGLELVELEPWYDVDERAALDRLIDELRNPTGGVADEAYAAPVTSACLERLGLRSAWNRVA